MEVSISDIRVPRRVRVELGELDGLVESLKECGQLNPLTVTRDLVLVAGHRRLEAARRLGWQSVDVRVVDGLDEYRCVRLEIEENLHRKEFTPEELLAGMRRLERLRNPPLYLRFGRYLRKALRALCFWRWFRRRPRHEEAKPAPPAGHA